MSNQKTLFHFFTKTPPAKEASNLQQSTSSLNGNSGFETPKAASVRKSTPKLSNGSSCKTKGKQPAPPLSKPPSETKVPDLSKKKRVNYSSSEEEDKSDDNITDKMSSNKPKRRRIAIASDSDDSDEYKPDKEPSSDDSSGTAEEDMKDAKKRKKKLSGKNLTEFMSPSVIGSPSLPKPTSLTEFMSPSIAGSPTTPKSAKKISSNQVVENGEESDIKEWFHEKLEFLKQGKIRDKQGNPASSLCYEPTTLFIPSDFMKTVTPGMKQWWELKSEHFDTVLFFKVGKFYELYHMDAVIGFKELGLVFMKGDFAHSGFPEPAFGRYAECLVEKGYKVARVEQTETPQMMEERCRKSSHNTKYDRVVKREICQITTKGTRTLTYQAESLGINNNFLLAISEKHVERADNFVKYGVCFIDTSIGKFTFGQFDDDRHRSRLLTLIALHPPAEVLCEKGSLSKETAQLLNHHLSGVKKEILSNMWSPMQFLKYMQTCNHFVECLPDREELNYPEALKKMLDPDLHSCRPLKQYEEAVKAFGTCLWYLKKCGIDDVLLTMKMFEEYIPVDEVVGTANTTSSDFKKHMVLDGVTLQNLEIVPLLPSDAADGTLLGTIDKCSTSFGKRLLRNWLCSPLCDPVSILERLDAIDDLAETSELIESIICSLKKLPDLERLLSKIHAYGLARDMTHPDSRAIFYEAESYNKKKITDFLSALEGFKLASDLMSKLQSHLNTFRSSLLKRCVSSEADGKFPKLSNCLEYFDTAFDHELAKKEGNIIPTPGVDKEYDFSSQEVDRITAELNSILDNQKRTLGCKVSFITSGKNRFMLEIPAEKKVPKEFEFQGGRKGFKRYYTEEIKTLLKGLSSAEESRKTALNDVSRRIFAHFDKDYVLWKTALSCISTLDVLISLLLYYKTSAVPMCRPTFSLPDDNTEPHLEIINGQHPTFLKYFTGDNYIPNSVYIGTKKISRNEDINCGGKLVLVTGPNMGGKSTLMRQAGTLLIMAHLGSYVPAESMKLTPVDRIFTRVGAHDRITKGESTFFVEASETSSILHHATKDSFVLVDELGRGTATYDGTAIAYAALDYLANDVGCRSLFSTHYHSLVEDFRDHPNVGLGHMACMIEDSESSTVERITFLYKFIEGACPKSYGFNVALLAGISKDIVKHGCVKARHLEQFTRISKTVKHLLTVKTPESIAEELSTKLQLCK